MHKKLLTATFDSRTFRFITKKTVNPNSGKLSAIESEFSAQNWNARTLRHLKDIHALGEARFNLVLDMASNSRVVRGRTRGVANPEPTSLENDSDDSDVTLRSEDNNELEEDEALHGCENGLESGEVEGYQDMDDDDDSNAGPGAQDDGYEGIYTDYY